MLQLLGIFGMAKHWVMILWLAYETECEYNAMVFDLLGPSLKNLFNYCGRKFSVKTVAYRSAPLPSRTYPFQGRHPSRHQAGEYLFGCGEAWKSDLCDGFRPLATQRRNAQVKANIGPARNAQLIGTARYASANGLHHGLDLARCHLRTTESGNAPQSQDSLYALTSSTGNGEGLGHGFQKLPRPLIVQETILGKEWVPYEIAQAGGNHVLDVPQPEEL